MTFAHCLYSLNFCFFLREKIDHDAMLIFWPFMSFKISKNPFGQRKGKKLLYIGGKRRNSFSHSRDEEMMMMMKSQNEINPEFPVLISNRRRFYLNILLLLYFCVSDGLLHDLFFAAEIFSRRLRRCCRGRGKKMKGMNFPEYTFYESRACMCG
jgi:hypothetical protein